MVKFSRVLSQPVVTATFMLSASATILLAATPPKHTEKVLYAFQNTEGAVPEGGALLSDKGGNLYGTASDGGTVNSTCSIGCGSVYKLAPNGTLTVIHSFAGTDGANPTAGVVRDKDGNLYGTTVHGGQSNQYCAFSSCGTVFKIAPDGTFTSLYQFKGGADGGNPFGGVALDKKGNLYGTAETGGSQAANCGAYRCGTVFKISPKGEKTTLYSFQGFQSKDGYNPAAGVTLGKDGTIYGSTLQGGTAGSCCGTIFKLTPDGKETILHSFNGKDGNGPTLETLLLDESGTLYGTTDSQGPGGCGTVFSLSASGTLTNLYSFTCGNDGGTPFGGLTRDKNGDLYGVASDHGKHQSGTVYKITPDNTFKVIYQFRGNKDGAYPYSAVLLKDGQIYGTTGHGGGTENLCAYGCGTVFSIKK